MTYQTIGSWRPLGHQWCIKLYLSIMGEQPAARILWTLFTTGGHLEHYKIFFELIITNGMQLHGGDPKAFKLFIGVWVALAERPLLFWTSIHNGAASATPLESPAWWYLLASNNIFVYFFTWNWTTLIIIIINYCCGGISSASEIFNQLFTQENTSMPQENNSKTWT